MALPQETKMSMPAIVRVSRVKPTCIDLRERFPGFRIVRDESHISGQEIDPWLLEIPCKYGKIYPYGGNELCAYTDHPRLKARLAALPGAVVHQEGDFELVTRFPVDSWEAYFRLLRAKRKRTASPAVKAALNKALEQRRKRLSWAVEARPGARPPRETSESIREVL